VTSQSQDSTTPPSGVRIDVLSVPEKPVGEYSMPSIVTVE
jgi:hypothetical protein